MTVRRPPWSPVLRVFADELFAKYPDAAQHCPCPCGLTLAVIPRSQVNPARFAHKLHFEVPDAALRDAVAAYIRATNRPESVYDGPDAVLVLTEVA